AALAHDPELVAPEQVGADAGDDAALAGDEGRAHGGEDVVALVGVLQLGTPQAGRAEVVGEAVRSVHREHEAPDDDGAAGLGRGPGATGGPPRPGASPSRRARAACRRAAPATGRRLTRPP